MAMKVYGSVRSPPTLRLFACLAEKELEAELLVINLSAAEHKKEPVISLNPFGQVPAFEDGDLKLFESRAINQYIAETYNHKGNQLIFEDPKKMAFVHAWIQVEAIKFDPPAARLAWELAIKPMLGMEAAADVDPIVEDCLNKLDKVLDVYEARLTESKYLAGESFTLADLHHLPCIHFLIKTRATKVFDSHPHVKAWCDDILARPAWSKVINMQQKVLATMH